MEVLQAVHLLLALDLFVVVVAVDPRWLLYSVRQHSSAFRESAQDVGLTEEERAHWQATPLNYLEKIFQIPFTLLPMGPGGFADLITFLAAPPGASDDAGGAPGASAVPPVATDLPIMPSHEAAPLPGGSSPEVKPVLPGPDVSPDGHQSGAGPEPRPVVPPDQIRQENTLDQVDVGSRETLAREASTAPAPAPTEPANAARHLQLHEHERAYMARLHRLIPSPRATTRFVNVYRLIKTKALLDDESDADFPEEPVAGGYQAVLLLLAMLIGFPGPTTEIIATLHEEGSELDVSWWDLLDSFRPRSRKMPGEPIGQAATWARLFEALDDLRQPEEGEPLLPDNEPCDLFVEWAPKVARYSFQSGRILLHQ
jgi:hypothetical protein